MSTTGIITSFTTSDNVRDVSTVFNRIQLPQTTLLNAVGMDGGALTNTIHYWLGS